VDAIISIDPLSAKHVDNLGQVPVSVDVCASLQEPLSFSRFPPIEESVRDSGSVGALRHNLNARCSSVLWLCCLICLVAMLFQQLARILWMDENKGTWGRNMGQSTATYASHTR
jgi:hypothetical protein